MNTHSPNHTHRWAILAILGIAQLMVVLDATIVMIALPSAQNALHFTNANRCWSPRSTVSCAQRSRS